MAAPQERRVLVVFSSKLKDKMRHIVGRAQRNPGAIVEVTLTTIDSQGKPQTSTRIPSRDRHLGISDGIKHLREDLARAKKVTIYAAPLSSSIPTNGHSRLRPISSLRHGRQRPDGKKQRP